MKRCYLFLLLFSLSVCLVVKAPEYFVVSHVMANSGISIMCSRVFRCTANGVEYSGELVRINKNDSSIVASKASFVDLTEDDVSLEETVLSVRVALSIHSQAQSRGSSIVVIEVDVTTDNALKSFDSTYKDASIANQINICGILISREAGERVSSLLKESSVYIEVSSQGECERGTSY